MNIQRPIAIGLFIFIFGVGISLCFEKKKSKTISIIIAFLMSIAANVISANIIGTEGPGGTTGPSLHTEGTLEIGECEIGDTISFGSYQYDSNGLSSIEWIVIDEDENKLLLLSRYALDCQPYNSRKTDVTWESSSLRQWLNGTFYQAAFNSSEKAKIVETTVAADHNPQYPTDPGNDTHDHVFLLSIDELSRYLRTDEERSCRATQFAFDQGAYENPSTGCCWWWLRSPGISLSDAASVNSDGSIDYDDGTVNASTCAVRPVIWIQKD